MQIQLWRLTLCYIYFWELKYFNNVPCWAHFVWSTHLVKSQRNSIRVVYSLTRTRRILDYRALWTEPTHVIKYSSNKTILTVQRRLFRLTRLQLHDRVLMTNIRGKQLMSCLRKQTHSMVEAITSVVSISRLFSFLCKFLSLCWIVLVVLYLLQTNLMELIQQT